VTAVTAGGPGSWSNTILGEVVMSNIQFDNSLLIEDRNERPLLVALVAIVAAWSVVLLLGL